MNFPTILRDAERRRTALAASVFVILLLAVCYPVLTTKMPPLADYPNHLARIYIQAYAEHLPTLGAYHQSLIRGQPNLAMDLFVLALTPFVSVEIGGRLSIIAAFVLMGTGGHVLARALAGRWSLWPNIVFLFVYNKLFQWGFISFMMGLGLMLWGIALWIFLRDRRWTRAAVACAVALPLYLSHLFAFAAYGVAITGYELYCLLKERAPWRRYIEAVLALGAQVVVPFLLFVFISPTAHEYGRISWGPFIRKVEALISARSSYNFIFDGVLLGTLLAIIVAGMLMRRLRFPMELIIAFVALFALGLAMPEQIFSSYFAAERIPLVLALIFAPTMIWAASAWRTEIAATAVMLAFFAVKMVMVTSVWHEADRRYAEVIPVLKNIPHGAKLMSVIVNEQWNEMLPPVPFFEIPTLSVVYRETFVPNLFAYPFNAAQAVKFTPAYAGYFWKTPYHILWPWDVWQIANDPAVRARRDAFQDQVLAMYDYVFVYNEKALSYPVPSWLETVASGPNFRLLRVPKTHTPAAG